MNNDKQLAVLSSDEESQVGEADTDIVTDEFQEDLEEESAFADNEEQEIEPYSAKNLDVANQEKGEIKDSKIISKGSEVDSKNAERRRMHEEKLKTEAYHKGIVDAINGINPYNGEKIKDKADIDEYLLMRDIDIKGGDAIADFPKYLKEKQRNEAQKLNNEQKSNEKQDWYLNDLAQFTKEHQDIDIQKLMTNKDFEIFARGKLGTEKLVNIYRDYISFTGKYETKADTKAKKLFAKAQASPGSLTGAESTSLSFNEMSDAEFEKQVQKALRGELSSD